MSSRAVLRFYAELNDFLPPEKRQTAFSHNFFGQPSVKDMIESLGIPHTEVDLIIAGDRSVAFNYRVKDGDRISVFPMFEAVDISAVLKVRPEPLREPRFILDTHLGRLANYLRMLGFDTLYQNNYDDETLARISAEQRRILLTRDRGLLKRSVVTHGYLIRADDPREQVKEVLQRFDLLDVIKPFSRCMRCNAILESVDFDQVKEKLPPRV
ncbi:MAG: Mut7-C RNAse domain-containing protein, partial [Bacillota bacterium]